MKGLSLVLALVSGQFSAVGAVEAGKVVSAVSAQEGASKEAVNAYIGRLADTMEPLPGVNMYGLLGTAAAREFQGELASKLEALEGHAPSLKGHWAGFIRSFVSGQKGEIQRLLAAPYDMADALAVKDSLAKIKSQSRMAIDGLDGESDYSADHAQLSDLLDKWDSHVRALARVYSRLLRKHYKPDPASGPAKR